MSSRAAVVEGEGPLLCTKPFQVWPAAKQCLVLPDMQQHECAMSWKAHFGEVYSVEFSCDENAVYSIGEDGKVGASGI